MFHGIPMEISWYSNGNIIFYTGENHHFHWKAGEIALMIILLGCSMISPISPCQAAARRPSSCRIETFCTDKYD